MRIRLPRNASTFDLKPFDFDRPKKEDRGLISLSSRLWNYEVSYMLIEAPFLPGKGNLVMLRGMIDKTDVQPTIVPTLFSTSKQSFLILIPPKRARKKRAPTHSNTQTFSYIPEGERSRKSLTYIAKKPLPVHEGKALREMKQPRGIIKRYARL